MAEVIRMPRMSDTMTEGTIVAWTKKVGDKVKSGDVLADVETDKATMELESYVNGTLLHIGIEAGNSVAVEQIIAIIGKEGEDISALLSGSDQKSAATTAVSESKIDEVKGLESMPLAVPSNHETNNQDINGRILASPLAKKIADDKGIDLHKVIGSGDNGRIIKKDVESIEASLVNVASQSTPSVVHTPEGQFEDVMLTNMRKTIARRLAESMYSAPHFYLTSEIIMDKTMDLRKNMIEATGEKVSFNDIIIKAVALALKKHPKVNASWLGDRIRYYNYVNIGVAIAVEDGLVVPVLRNADQLGITSINKSVKDFAEKAKAKKLQPTDYEGNTFSISNLGMFGIDHFTAIINPPDACILAVGRIKETVVAKNGAMQVANIMNVTLSCDHRVVDGAIGAQFLQTLRMFLEEPLTMLS
jgi:pyruvate dehydrogenase E2 component (dihydrolipoamide acetyltransferase)